MESTTRYFIRHEFPVKLEYNKSAGTYEAYIMDLSTGEIRTAPNYVAKVLGYAYPPGSDMYFDEISGKEYSEAVARRVEKINT